MNIWILSDGRPGHFNQSKGVIVALRQHFDVREHWLDAKTRSSFLRFVGRFVLNNSRSKLSLSLLHLFCRIGNFPKDPPDLIVSAGGNTFLANAWLARHFGCKNIVCGSLRGFRKSQFSQVITYEQEKAGQAGYILSPTPVAFEKEKVDRAGAEFRQRSGLVDARLWTALIGGNGSGYRWRSQDWIALAEALNKIARDHQVQWLLVTSLRTTKTGDELLKKHVEPGTLAAAHFVTSEQDVSYIESLGACERVFCTEDSHMMITEAIAMARQVHTLQPKNFQTTSINKLFIDMYLKADFISRHSVDVLNQDRFEIPQNLKISPKSVSEELGEKLYDWWHVVN